MADGFVVDLLAKACAIDYEEAKNGIEWQEVEGVRIPIPNKRLLIRMKDTIRPSDRVDVDFLRQSIEEEKNLAPSGVVGVRKKGWRRGLRRWLDFR